MMGGLYSGDNSVAGWGMRKQRSGWVGKEKVKSVAGCGRRKLKVLWLDGSEGGDK